MPRYFNLNIKHPLFDAKRSKETARTGAAAYWLDEKCKAVVYFGLKTVESIKEVEKPIEAFNFIQLGDTEAEWSTSFIVTIQNGHIWIFNPAGPVEDGETVSFTRPKSDLAEIDILKIMPIKVLPGFPKKVSQVPLILASMRANQAFSRNTFREIDAERYSGNIAAIKSVIQNEKWGNGFKIDPLECLSSVELETLVAKLFEAHDCFVPAYKGGFLADVDLFVTPRSRVELAGICLDPTICSGDKKTWSVQIKLTYEKDKRLEEWLQSDRHLLVTLSEPPSEEGNPSFSSRHLGRAWLREALTRTPSVHEWLKESLSWLPTNFQSPPLNAVGNSPEI